jgi:hypothetical protein
MAFANTYDRNVPVSRSIGVVGGESLSGVSISGTSWLFAVQVKRA